jgi:hypothetical protein
MVSSFQAAQITSMIANACWGVVLGSEVQCDGWDEWVEVSPSCPGDVSDNPCVVYCVCGHALGSATARTYEYV